MNAREVKAQFGEQFRQLTSKSIDDIIDNGHRYSTQLTKLKDELTKIGYQEVEVFNKDGASDGFLFITRVGGERMMQFKSEVIRFLHKMRPKLKFGFVDNDDKSISFIALGFDNAAKDKAEPWFRNWFDKMNANNELKINIDLRP